MKRLILTGLMVILGALPAFSQPLNEAAVGDSYTVLIHGLIGGKFAPTQYCRDYQNAGIITVSGQAYLTPVRFHESDTFKTQNELASTQVIRVEGRPTLVITYDEHHLSAPAALYVIRHGLVSRVITHYDPSIQGCDLVREALSKDVQTTPPPNLPYRDAIPPATECTLSCIDT